MTVETLSEKSALYQLMEDPMYYNPLFDVDFYKFGHVEQYPMGTRQIWSNWTPRGSRTLDQKHIVWFGGQYYYMKKLMYMWNKYFFDRPEEDVVREYKDFIHATLGKKDPYVSHIQRLHRQGYLPIDIYALPEGVNVPLGVPPLVITNTKEHAFWLPNYLETDLSNMLWKASTSATTAQRFRKLFVEYAKKSGEKDLSFVDWQGHDFSYRGMSGKEDAILSGMGHLLSFAGTDTAPAILQAKKFYGGNLSDGGSVDATEHSVMCAGRAENEFDTFERLVTKVYPSGIVSIVSDTWDLWRVLTDYVPKLRAKILARPGTPSKVVFRPDSGDPVKIVCGNPDYTEVPNTKYPMMLEHHPAYHGALDILGKAMGMVTAREGLPLIDHAGIIYGDSINYERGAAILDRIVNDLKMSPYNMVFGIGSFTYEYTTRDQYSWAMKATAVKDNSDVLQAIFKDPITDYDAKGAFKKSLKGIPAVYRTEDSTEEKPVYFVKQESTPEALDKCAFRKVFHNGELLVTENFAELRKRVRA